MRVQLTELVRKRRAQLGWTQRELAAAVGSSASRISKLEANDVSVSLDLILRVLSSMSVSLVVHPSESADPLADPELSAEQCVQLSGELLKRQIAERIANRHNVDAGDVRHVLTNLEHPPLQRLGSMFQRARLGRQSVH